MKTWIALLARALQRAEPADRAARDADMRLITKVTGVLPSMLYFS